MVGFLKFYSLINIFEENVLNIGHYYVLIFFDLLKFRQKNDITGYSPFNARARDEYSAYQNFFAQDGRGVTVYIYALAQDSGSMLRETHLKEIVQVNYF